MEGIPPLHANAPEVPPHIANVPQGSAKIVHVIRHGKGYHNGARLPATLLAGDMDAHLNEIGWSQCLALNEYLKTNGLEVDLVVVSPLRRTLETAAGVFGHPFSPDDEASKVVMVEQGDMEGRVAPHPAIACPRGLNIVALELIRETIGVEDCDRRRSIREQAQAFPGVDFSLVEHDEDLYWSRGVREPVVHMQARGRKFSEWLLARPEQRIAVVSHQGFICEWWHTFGQDESIAGERLHKFKNCELRSISLLGQGSMALRPDDLQYQGFKLQNKL